MKLQFKIGSEVPPASPEVRSHIRTGQGLLAVPAFQPPADFANGIQPSANHAERTTHVGANGESVEIQWTGQFGNVAEDGTFQAIRIQYGVPAADHTDSSRQLALAL